MSQAETECTTIIVAELLCQHNPSWLDVEWQHLFSQFSHTFHRSDWPSSQITLQSPALSGATESFTKAQQKIQAQQVASSPRAHLNCYSFSPCHTPDSCASNNPVAQQHACLESGVHPETSLSALLPFPLLSRLAGCFPEGAGTSYLLSSGSFLSN